MAASSFQPSEPDGMSRFLWWLSAADESVLKECPSDQERYRITGLAVLVTWLFATLAWGYFFSTVTDDTLVVIGLALFFGFAILCIDRLLLSAMSRNYGKKKWLPVFFRLALAVTIGLFISQPVVLMLFKKDVLSQLEISKQRKLEEFRKKEAAMEAGTQATWDNELKRWQQQLEEKEAQVKTYKDAYIRETDGTGGSGKIGAAAIAQVKKTEYLKAEEELILLRRTLAPQQAARLAALDTLRQTREGRAKVYSSQLSDGFLAQTEALQELTDHHPALQARYRLIVFLITLIEILPMLSKLLMPPGEYDERLAARGSKGSNTGQLQQLHRAAQQ